MDTATSTPATSTPAASSSPPSQSSPPTRRRHGAWHVIGIVVGCLMILPGIGMLIGGVAAASAQAFATDDGYFRHTLDRIDTDGVAIAATDLWLDGNTRDDGPDWLLDNLDVDLRLRVTGAASTEDVFVAIARTPDVEDYLAGAPYSDVIEMDGHTARLVDVSGTESVEPPESRDFWAATASGQGEQELTWDARGGEWAAVIMNVDGSPDVAADVEIGVRSGAVMPIAIVLMVIGGLVLAVGIFLIVVGAKGRRVEPTEPTRGSADVPTGSTDVPLPPPTSTDADQAGVPVEHEQDPTLPRS